MEDNIEHEYECQICMDLLDEPSTTVCGHTFCKICLIRYLQTKLNCPMCRKPILQSRESLAKNVTLENIIKSKYPIKYEERRKVSKLLHSEDTNTDDNFRNNMFSLILRDVYVWPKVKRRIRIEDPNYNYTVTLSSANDRLLVIIPGELNNTNENSSIACIVEIHTIAYENNTVILEVEGLKRFKVREFRNSALEDSQPIYVSTGEIIKDLEVQSEELLFAMANKLHDVGLMNSEILAKAPYTFIHQLENCYGKIPANSRNVTPNMSTLEQLSFFYLNVIKNEEKKMFYLSSNIIERVDWIYDKYSQAFEHADNPSLPLNFYDLQVSGVPKNQLKFTLTLFLAFIIFGLAVKYKIITI